MKMISHKRRKMDKIKGNWVENFIIKKNIKQQKFQSVIYKIKSSKFFKFKNIWKVQKKIKGRYLFWKKVWFRKKNKVYYRAYSIYIEFNKFRSHTTSTQIREKLFEIFENIKISVGIIYKILKNNDF